MPGCWPWRVTSAGWPSTARRSTRPAAASRTTPARSSASRWSTCARRGPSCGTPSAGTARCRPSATPCTAYQSPFFAPAPGFFTVPFDDLPALETTLARIGHDLARETLLTAEEIAAYLKLGKRLPARLRSGKPNPVFYLLLRAYKTRLPKPGSRMELTDEQRSLIRAANARSNERLRAEFFPEQASLFDSADG